MPLLNTFGAASARGFGLTTGASLSLIISSDTNNYNIFTAAGSPTVPVAVMLVIDSGVNVYSTSTSTYALDTGTGWVAGSTITIANSGKIIGMGGAGGYGGYWVSGIYYGGAEAGFNGGPSLRIQYATTITGSGSIVGGGGGGGGGGGNIISGLAVMYGGNGGGGGNNGAGGNSGYLTPGGTGTFIAGGAGTAPSNGYGAYGGYGGDGGYGTNGINGAPGTGSPGYNFGGALGGAAGNAITGISNVLANSNTVTGPTS
jgi:hypothetical protein